MRLKFFGRFCLCFTLIHVNIVVYAGLFTNTHTWGEADVELTSLLHATFFCYGGVTRVGYFLLTFVLFIMFLLRFVFGDFYDFC